MHAGQALLLPVDRRRPAGLVVDDDQLAVVAEVEAVDDAAQGERADVGGEAQLDADRVDPGRVLHRQVALDELAALGVERGELLVVEAEQVDELGQRQELVAGDGERARKASRVRSAGGRA